MGMYVNLAIADVCLNVSRTRQAIKISEILLFDFDHSVKRRIDVCWGTNNYTYGSTQLLSATMTCFRVTRVPSSFQFLHRPIRTSTLHSRLHDGISCRKMVELATETQVLKPTANQKSRNSEDIEQLITPPQETFPFMRLPPEIRNMIYKQALVIPPGIIRLNVDNRYPDRNPACPLLSTCRTIYAEAAIFYYGLNRFNLYNMNLLGNWLRSVRPESRRLISRITMIYAGQTSIKDLKSLAEFVDLKELYLHIDVRTFSVHMMED